MQLCALITSLTLSLTACREGKESDSASSPGGHGRGGGGASARRGDGPSHGAGPPAPGAGAGPERGVPVEIAATVRHSISLYFETHGALEAENEVDLVARLAGPIVELKVEEGQRVRKGQLLARIDDREMRAALEVSEVRREETQLSYERVKRLFGSELVSQETVDQALANYQSAQGDHERLRVQLHYTEITAPFSGLIVNRYVKFAEHLSINQALFRLSDFDPLLCPIQVPEREIPRLRRGQPARLEVEAWPGEAFSAEVLRISPVVNAETGTVKVTLEVEGQGRLRPGMFASVFLEVETRPDALVVPKAALALDTLEDTVFVASEGLAHRRVLKLGFQSDDSLEVLEGLVEGEEVIVVGQDGLNDGTPIEILGRDAPGARGPAAPDEPPGAGGGSDSMDGPPSPERLERMKARMKKQGLSEEEIEERLRRMRRQRGGQGS